jgi:hypothetical protein
MCVLFQSIDSGLELRVVAAALMLPHVLDSNRVLFSVPLRDDGGCSTSSRCYGSCVLV